MRLSDAIRLGVMLKPAQAFYVLYDPATGASCALGAAADALGLLDTTRRNAYTVGAKGPDTWRWMQHGSFECPACEGRDDDAQALIIHLNNDHRWTRERIADWVATIEPPDMSAEPPDTSVSTAIPHASATP
jgi:hypothetical protein